MKIRPASITYSPSSRIQHPLKAMLLVFWLFFTTLPASYSQNWQWLKDGGSYDSFSENLDRNEEIFDMVTDSDKNVYVLAQVGYSNLTIDGNPKTAWGGDPVDFALVSFACDGSYRWSKIIGGGSNDRIKSIEIDNNDNIYVVGNFVAYQDTNHPPRIDNDVIISQSPPDYRLMFLAKFDKNGVFQWIKRPEPSGFTTYMGSGYEMYIGQDGYIYWITGLKQGVFCDGLYTNSYPNTTYHILKYNTNGDFISGTYLDSINLTGSGSIKFFRNPYNGFVFLQGWKASSTATYIVGGQPITHPTFLACFNASGVFQWVRENTNIPTNFLTPKTVLYEMDFDPENNLYIAGKQSGNSADNFLGLSIPELRVSAFMMKTDPTASNTLWSNYYSMNGADNNGGIKYHNGVVSYAGYGGGSAFTWSGITENINGSGNSVEPILVHFNAQTGVALSINWLQGDNGVEDKATAIAVDASGDYILGGGFGHYLYDMNGNQVINGGGRYDFFVAKFATEPCSVIGVNELDQGSFEIYPNPAHESISITGTTSIEQIKLFNLMGQLIREIPFTSGTTVLFDLKGIPSGTYLLKIKTAQGEKMERLIID